MNRSAFRKVSWTVMSGECRRLASVSSQQTLGALDMKAFGESQLSGLGQAVL